MPQSLAPKAPRAKNYFTKQSNCRRLNPVNIRFLLVVILLLTAVATTGCSDYQVSPLASAARRGDVAGIAVLIRRGASTEEGTGVNNWTPLQHAIHKNQAQAAFAPTSPPPTPPRS